jgi:hypothetical protein
VTTVPAQQQGPVAGPAQQSVEWGLGAASDWLLVIWKILLRNSPLKNCIEGRYLGDVQSPYCRFLKTHGVNGAEVVLELFPASKMLHFA